MDITDVIARQHDEQRWLFAALDEIDPSDTTALTAVWKRLAVLLEVHAEAEEKYFYPRLLKVGTGGADADSVDEETKDAIKDHNEIRDAVRAAEQHPVGSQEWWDAVLECRKANDEHMAEEERQDLLDFRRHADLQTRHEIAVQFITYENQHAFGIRAEDHDPDEYVEEHS